MKIQLLDHFRRFLLHAPPYSSTFLLVQEWTEPVLVMRVPTLVPFQHERYRARVGFRAWQNAAGTWVVSVPFCLELWSAWPVTGMPCLNPRRVVDYGVMQQFATEPGVRFVFFSGDLEEAITAWVPWPAAQQRRVSGLMTAIDQTLTGAKQSGAFDPDFEQAKQELQALLSTVDDGRPVGDLT